MEETKQLVETITDGIQDKKGQDIVIADLQKIDGAIAKYFVICQGQSPTQVEAIAESIGDKVREHLHEKPVNASARINGSPLISLTSWYMSSSRKYASSMTWRICGRMPN